MGVFSLINQVTATAFLFPGQGSQQVGMAQSVAAAYPAARATLDEADAVLGFAISRLMAEGPEAELTDTINAQPALLAASVAVMRALEAEFGDRASRSGGQQVFVAGHSLGEYTALVAAGSLTYADGLRLVRERGRLMKEAGEHSPGMMAAVLGLDEATIARVCAETTAGVGVAEIANDNTHGQVVISGDRAGMEAAMAALSAAGAKRVMPLAVSIAAHSRLMQPVAAALQAAIDATPLLAPAVPVIGNTVAQPLATVDDIRRELAAQLTGSVRWTATIQWLEAAGVTTFAEIGPGEVLSGLVKRTARGAKRVNVAEAEQVAGFVLT
jgi:[acyl-carrier-protein] S-malonyltransferase